MAWKKLLTNLTAGGRPLYRCPRAKCVNDGGRGGRGFDIDAEHGKMVCNHCSFIAPIADFSTVPV